MKRVMMWAAAIVGGGAGVMMMASGQPQDGKPATPAGNPAAQPPTAPADKPAEKKPAAANGGFDPAVMAEFKSLEGTWDLEVIFRFQPGADPVKTTGTMVSKVILDGMFLEQTMEGNFGPAMGNKAWTSRSIYGYNPVASVLQVVRMSNSNSIMIPVRGPYRPGDAKYEVSGQYQLMGLNCSERDVTTVLGPDKRQVESYMSFGKAAEFKGFEMVATRRK